MEALCRVVLYHLVAKVPLTRRKIAKQEAAGFLEALCRTGVKETLNKKVKTVRRKRSVLKIKDGWVEHSVTEDSGVNSKRTPEC